MNLLRQPHVMQWIMGDVSFIESVACKKTFENEWGRGIMKTHRPDLKMDKQWTNKFGENVCEEVYTLLGKNVYKPVKKNRLCPDLETDEFLIEVKTGTFFTEGSAHEKILGCPFKYAEVPELYGKPLKIVCIGGAEKLCREVYGNLPGSSSIQSAQKQKFIEFFRSNGIEFIGLSDIIRNEDFVHATRGVFGVDTATA